MNMQEEIDVLTTSHMPATRSNDIDDTGIINTDVPFEMNRFAPMGIKIIMDLPFVPADSRILFAIRVTPWYMHPFAATPANMNVHKVAIIPPSSARSTYAQILNSRDPIDPKKEPPIRAYHYELPPASVYHALQYRHWNGEMRYRMQTSSASITHGYVRAVLARNVYWPVNMNVDPLQYYDPPLEVYPTSMFDSENYTRIDLSQNKHAEFSVPWEHNLPWRDQVHLNSSGQDYLIFYAESPITSLTTASITFTFEIAMNINLSTEIAPLSITRDPTWHALWGRLTTLYKLVDLIPVMPTTVNMVLVEARYQGNTFVGYQEPPELKKNIKEEEEKE